MVVEFFSKKCGKLRNYGVMITKSRSPMVQYYKLKGRILYEEVT